MTENITLLTDPIMEKTTPKITATIQDEDGVAISSANLTTLTLTLYNLSDSTIINSRSAQNVLNANNVTVDTNGLMTWSVQTLDTIIVGTSKYEEHRAVFEWTYSAGAKNGKYVIDMSIYNLVKIT